MLDPERVRALAQQRGMSESAAVREAVEYALAADEVMAAIRRLHESRAFADFEDLYPRLTDPSDDLIVEAYEGKDAAPSQSEP